jgi:4-amino-4-deoxy-L-arabinose transferase-like glycosyltransferase
MPRPPNLPRRHAAILLLLSLVLLLLGLRPRELWGPDEAIVGTIVREMVVEGEWLVPHVNGEVYPDKPPLYYWLAAAPAFLTGTVMPLWFRLPATLAAIGCLWLLYALGARLMSRTTGLMAAAILATTPLFTISAQIARMDMLLTLLIMAMFYCFVRGLQEPARHHRWFLAVYPLAGLAFLTKGLIGPVIAGFVIGSVIVWQREWRAFLRIEPGWGLVLAGGVVLPWLIPAVLAEGIGYAGNLLITQSVGRTVSSFAHDRPLYYYLYAFPPSVLPWIVFLPGALWRLWRHWRQGGDQEKWRFPLLLAWTVGLFLIFSAISGKLVIYLLPLCPALALVVADWWHEAFAAPDSSASRRHLVWPAVLSVGLLAGGAGLLPATALLPAGIPHLLLFGYAGAVALAVVIALGLSRPPLPVRLFGLLLVTIGLAFAVVTSAVPRVDAVMSPKRLAELLPGQTANVAMATYKVRPGLLNYYAGRRFETLADPAAVRAFLAQTAPALCVIREDQLGRIWEELPEELRVIGRHQMNRATYVVIANAARPPDGTAGVP